MQINLKQTEITQALRQYVTQQGIDLTDKTVDISFIAGRKEGGLTAEINIEDQDIPGFSGNVVQPVQLSLVGTAESEIVAAEPAGPGAVEIVAKQEFPVEQKTTSLFS